MRCPNCHAEISDSARFCTECGANLQLVQEGQTQSAKTAANTALVLGQAARRVRLEAVVDPDEMISVRAYNAVMIGVVVWGLLVNVVLCAYVGNVFRYISPVLFYVLYFVCAFAGIWIAGKSDNPAVSFLGYNLVVVPFGLVISALVWQYGGLDSQVVRDAFFYTLVITLGMLGLEMMFPAFFEKIGMALLGCLISLIICEIVLLILRVQQSVTGWIGAALFSLYIGYDIHRSQQFPKTVDNAVDCALDIYLDIANLFIRLLQIMGKKNKK